MNDAAPDCREPGDWIGEVASRAVLDIGLRTRACLVWRLQRGQHFKNVWLGSMSKTPRWRKSGEALSYTFGIGGGG
jgi:hypothetical protein